MPHPLSDAHSKERGEHWQFHAFTPDSDRLRYRRSPEFQGLEPETVVILRFSILGTPLFNSRLWLIGPGHQIAHEVPYSSVIVPFHFHLAV